MQNRANLPCGKNPDVYLGWIGWAAGGFDQTYALVETLIQ